MVKNEIDTPALLLDLQAMESNLGYMAEFFAKREIKLRPHVKLHKATPVLAHMQSDPAYTQGLTCAKLSEAECLAQAGLRDILIANQIVGPRKIQRLVSLASYSEVMVAIENEANAEAISQAAAAGGVQVRALIEVDIGHHRSGVQPFEPTLDLARRIVELPGLRFMGLMGYDGHCTMKMPVEEREANSKAANQLLVDASTFLRDAGVEVEIVSGSGTFTYTYAVQVPGLTEIQAGTYLLNDTAFYDAGVTEFQPALTVLATIISRQRRPGSENLAIIDLGRKAIDTYYGLPKVKHPRGATVVGLSQEHGRVTLAGEAEALDVGDKIELWVSDANGTINIYDEFHALQGEVVEAVWPIPARGKAT
jgi:D-serine deaminase-like pyridoxal phosphate-dependent protein